ncbi:MAG: ABC transporter permease [Thaumarchaeota archaeon]|nr:ABC transporter permease [Nitrososphaerota archaeon]
MLRTKDARVRRLHFPTRLKTAYVRRRIITTVIIFLVVYLLNFIIPRLEPGSILSAIHGADLLPAQREQLLQMLGVNTPYPQQFENYLKDTFLTFPPNFGISFARYPLPVWALVTQALPWTLLLVGISQAIAWTSGVLLGAWLAWHRGSKADSAMFSVSNFMWGVPSYWLATIFIYVFAIRLKLFPAALSSSGAIGFNLGSAESILLHSFLPILTLVVLNFPQHALVMRNTMVGVLQEDFIKAAEARGLRTRTLVLGHAARNALLPSITNLALGFGAILSGAYLVEIIFSYPGLGYLIEQSAIGRDYPVLEAIFFFSAMLVLIANLAADIAYTFLDPRVENE